MKVMHCKMVRNLIFMEIHNEKWSKNYVCEFCDTVGQQSKFNNQISLIIQVNRKVSISITKLIFFLMMRITQTLNLMCVKN